jgi:hypothetical protein
VQVQTIADASRANRGAAHAWARLMTALGQGRIDVETLDILTGIVPRGLYEHFKSKEHAPKFYLVYGVVPDVNGKFDPVVHYTSLYGPLAGKPAGRSLLDPHDGFWGPIVRPNDPEYPWEGPRFTLIKRLSMREFSTLMENLHRIAACVMRDAVIAQIERELGPP